MAREEFILGLPAFILEGMSIFRPLEKRNITGKTNYQWGRGGGGGGQTNGIATYMRTPNNMRTLPFGDEFLVTVPSSKGDFTFTTFVFSTPAGKTATDVMDAFVSGINDILYAESDYFAPLVGTNLTVIINSKNNVLAEWNSDPNNPYRTSYIAGFFNGNTHTIYFSVEGLFGTEPSFKYSDGIYKYLNQPFAIIAHEFAHARHLAQVGVDQFNSYISDNYYTDWTEHYARKWTNYIREKYNLPQEFNRPPKFSYYFTSWYLIRNLFFPKGTK